MSIAASYNQWANQYDTNVNKTRDAEHRLLQQMLQGKSFDTVIEMGCGTGKNTAWLQTVGRQVKAFDFSAGMLAEAAQKNWIEGVSFQQADLLKPWPVDAGSAQLVVFSLVLEHVQDLSHPFCEAFRVLQPGGILYVGELHPFKQYTGSKARFSSDEGETVVTCYTHHFSEFIEAALRVGFVVAEVAESFDEEQGLPRVLGLRFAKP